MKKATKKKTTARKRASGPALVRQDVEVTWVEGPTRTYRGVPGGPNGGVVTVDDGRGQRTLVSANGIGFGWGVVTVPASVLALALLDDALGDHLEATKYYQRFKHRVVRAWPADAPWSITLTDILAVIEDIKRVERETAGERSRVMLTPSPVVNEGAMGVARSDHDQGPGPRVEQPSDDPAVRKARADALAKLTDEEKRALGL